MRSIEEIQQALYLLDQGLSIKQVSQELDIPYFTVRDWKKDPSILQRFQSRNANQQYNFAQLPKETYAYLLGLYLGDGCITADKKGVYRLRIFLDAIYPNIISQCEQAMLTIFPDNKVGFFKKDGCYDVHMSSKKWVQLFPQHGPGKKHDRPIILADWQEEILNAYSQKFLPGLHHSDGSYGIANLKNVRGDKTYEYSYPRYWFTNCSADILNLYVRYANLNSVYPRRATWKSIEVSKLDEVAILDTFLGPKT